MNRNRKRKLLRHEALKPRQMLAGDGGFSPWTHPIAPHDVNGDGDVTAVDALIVINRLNRPDVPAFDASVPPDPGWRGDARRRQR